MSGSSIQLTRKPVLVGKAFRLYLLASVLTVAASQIAAIIDATIVGNMLGEDALAAVNLSKPLQQGFMSVCWLYLAGATMLCGMAIGRGDRLRADRLFSCCLAVTFILGGLITVSGMMWFSQLSHAMCQLEQLREMSDDYMRITVLIAVPQMITIVLNQFVTIDGNPRLVSRSVLVGNIFNILFDIIFIKYFGWGISGAAAATGLMYVICIIMVLPHFFRKGSLRLRTFKAADVEPGRMLTFGLPLFFSTVLLSVQFLGNNYVAGHFLGENGLKALAVCMQMFSFSMIILTGTLRTIQPVGSILSGLNDNTGMRILLRRGYRFMAVCFAVFTAILVFLPAQTGALLGVTGGEGMAEVRRALPMFSLHIVAQAMLCNVLPFYQFYGRNNMAMALSASQALLPMVFFWLMHGNWIGFFCGQMATFVIIYVWGIILRRKSRKLSPLFLIPDNDSDKVADMTVLATKQSLSEAIFTLRSALEARNVNGHTVFVAALCTEEFAKNIIEHGKASAIDVAATVSGNQVIVSLRDDGVPFNPVDFIRDSGEKLGLGLTLASAYCKDVKYRYIFNQNMVTLTIDK